MKRTWIALIIALAVALSLATTARADSSGDWIYDVHGGKATLIRYTGSDTEIIVPASIGGYPVESLGGGNKVFQSVAGTMTDLILEKGIRAIAADAVRNCTALEWVYIPGTVASIGDRAFLGCSALYDMNLSEGIEQVGSQCFTGTDLNVVFLPSTLSRIGTHAFGWISSAEQNKTFSVYGYADSAAREYAEAHHFTFYYRDDMKELSGRCGPDARWVFDEAEGTLFIEGTGATDTYYNGFRPWHTFLEDIRLVIVCEGITALGDSFPAKDYPNLREIRLPTSLTAIGEKMAFLDVPMDAFYYDSTAWALERGISNGLSPWEFCPNAPCSRAQAVTFLWRAAGCPEPRAAEHPFADVEKGCFYEKAVLWAVEQGIVTGTDETHFNPDGICTRAAAVTLLYRAQGSPFTWSFFAPFPDVPTGLWYTEAVRWASRNGISYGLSPTVFGPGEPCSRAQMVTLLYRAYA